MIGRHRMFDTVDITLAVESYATTWIFASLNHSRHRHRKIGVVHTSVGRCALSYSSQGGTETIGWDAPDQSMIHHAWLHYIWPDRNNRGRAMASMNIGQAEVVNPLYMCCG